VAPSDSPASNHSITMWGPSGTGKTTFLAALSIALIRLGSAWGVTGADEDSTQKLIELTMGLTTDRSYPQGTIGIAHYRWVLDGQLTRKVRRRWSGSKWCKEDVRIGLDLVDSFGELVGSRARDRSLRTDVIKNLVNSSAIIFLYDPITEVDRADAFDHTFGVLQQLARQTQGPPGTRLPHYVAVCVTKFDEIRLLETAEKLGLLSYDTDPPGFPQVADEDAREFFIELCKVRPDSDADMVVNLLEQRFKPERIKYFITSAIGFYVDGRTGRFNPDDYQNHLPDSADLYNAKVRGQIRPINVVEPLLWLADKLTTSPEQ
jgi:hypothetical protein